MISIENAIIHTISADNQGKLTCQLSPKPLSQSQALDDTLEELHRIYTSKAGKGYGHFGIQGDDGEANVEFKNALQAMLSEQQDFTAFSAKAGKLLEQELGKYDFAQGGFLLLATYSHMACDYLFVALLSAKPSLTIGSDLELAHNEHLDLNNLQLAARIDLTEWQRVADSNKYISFVKGRAGRKVADFFLDFMGCSEGSNAKAQSKALLEVVEKSLTQQEMDQDQSQQVRELVFNYCSEQLDAGAPVQLDVLSEQLSETGLQDFSSYADSAEIALEQEFHADKAQLRQLKKFSGTGGGVSISFEGMHLGQRVIYNAEADTLTIHGVPPNLKDQLKRRGQ